MVIHALPRVRQALDPFFATYYAVPIFIFYPVMIAIFGLSVMPIVLMGVATAIVAMIIATLNGLDRIPRVLTKVARVHRMGTVATALRLKLPAAAPHLFTGVKLAVSYGFIGVIASEFILAPSGLGRVISDAYSDFNNPRMYALMLLLVIVATVVNMLLHVFDQRWAERRGIAQAMTATKRATDTLIILIVAAAGVAGAAPGRRRDRAAGAGADAGLSRQVRADRALCRERLGDAGVLLLRADPVLRDRARDRRLDGHAPAVRRGRRADPDLALHAAEDHALSGGAADLRPHACRAA